MQTIFLRTELKFQLVQQVKFHTQSYSQWSFGAEHWNFSKLSAIPHCRNSGFYKIFFQICQKNKTINTLESEYYLLCWFRIRKKGKGKILGIDKKITMYSFEMESTGKICFRNLTTHVLHCYIWISKNLPIYYFPFVHY